MPLPNRAKSGWEIASELKTAILSGWAATVAELELLWSTSELETSVTSTDVAIGHLGDWSGGLGMAVVGTGEQYEWESLGTGGARMWGYEILVWFPPTGDAEQTVRMIEHYLQVIWVCLADYAWGTAEVVACIDEVRRMVDIRTPEIDIGVTGGTLEIAVRTLHTI